jgi:aspartyl/asparaginyl beta-hydroxylase (cupin superfamily)
MIDLPIFEQRMIVSTGLFSKMLLDTIQVISKSDIGVLKDKLIQQVNIQMSGFSDAEVTQFLRNYLKLHEELVNKHNRLLPQPEDNN